ncbi:MAG: hypothetical protein EPN91_09545 [Salinibacterium sp.]|nr:MAG: hypothetical protein EPN91_09545 [Salinibacterium sp.]
MSTDTKIRAWIVLFIIGLAVSGLTAFPLEPELRLVSAVLHATPAPTIAPDFVWWIDHVRDALIDTNNKYPFMAYGTDWLAFAHVMIAIVFVGPLRDPIRNIWVIQFGMIACACVIPATLITGAVRGIPIVWQLIDMSFGVFGIIPLLIVYRVIRKLEREKATTADLVAAWS